MVLKCKAILKQRFGQATGEVPAAEDSDPTTSARLSKNCIRDASLCFSCRDNKNAACWKETVCQACPLREVLRTSPHQQLQPDVNESPKVECQPLPTTSAGSCAETDRTGHTIFMYKVSK